MSHRPEGSDDRGSLALSALDSPEVVEERMTLVAAALEAPVHLGTFTDEELAALDDLTTTPAQPSPWYADLDENEKQIALSAALRGLTARGVLQAEPISAEDRTYTAYVEPGLGALLTLRRFVPYVVVAERTTAEFVDWAVFYPQRAGVFLGEYIDQRGLHSFVLADSTETVAGLAQWVGSFDGETDELDVTLSRDEIAARPDTLLPITDALFATTFTRLDPESDDDAWTALYTGRAGSYAATQVEADLRYRSIDADDLDEVLRGVIA